MSERWRPVNGYEGHYEVSDTGLVRSVWTPVPRLLRPRYSTLLRRNTVTLSLRSRRKTRTVARLVAETFLAAPAKGQRLRHRNGDLRDDRAENLYWDDKAATPPPPPPPPPPPDSPDPSGPSDPPTPGGDTPEDKEIIMPALPTPGSASIFDVVRSRNAETVRSFLYVLVPVVLVALQVDHADLWIGLALAALAPALAAIKSVDSFRTWFYGVLAAGQSVLLGLNLFTEAQITPWIAVTGAVVGGAVAASNVHAVTE